MSYDILVDIKKRLLKFKYEGAKTIDEYIKQTEDMMEEVRRENRTLRKISRENTAL